MSNEEFTLKDLAVIMGSIDDKMDVVIEWLISINDNLERKK